MGRSKLHSDTAVGCWTNISLRKHISHLFLRDKHRNRDLLGLHETHTTGSTAKHVRCGPHNVVRIQSIQVRCTHLSACWTQPILVCSDPVPAEAADLKHISTTHGILSRLRKSEQHFLKEVLLNILCNPVLAT